MAAYESKRARIVREVRESIVAGIYRPGEKLPVARDLAARVNAGLSTAQDALDQLKEEGLIEGRQGDGYYVSTGPRKPTLEDRVAALESRVERLERGEQ